MAPPTPTATVPLPVWATIRTGLNVVRREAAALIAIPFIAMFLAAGAVSGLDAFTKNMLMLPLHPKINFPLIAFVSMMIAWLAAVPLAVRTLEAPPRSDPESSLIERTWRAASARTHALSLRAFLRGVGLVLVNCGVLVGSLLPLIGLAALIGFDGPVFLVIVIAMIFVSLFALWVLLRLSLAFPAMVMEDLRVRKSLRRSWHITKSQTGRLLALDLVAAVLAEGLVLVLVLPLVIVLALVIYFGMLDASNPLIERIGFVVGLTAGVVLFAPITGASYYHLSRTKTDNE